VELVRKEKLLVFPKGRTMDADTDETEAASIWRTGNRIIL